MIHTRHYPVDEDKSGTITLSELRKAVKDRNIRHRFEMLGITLRDAKVLFATLTATMKSGKLSIDAFVDGCMKMKGSASSLDLQAVSFQVRELAGQLRMLTAHIKNLEALENQGR